MTRTTPGSDDPHVVERGECLSSIAHSYGFMNWRVIYDDDRNAPFRALRSNPNLIYPGDELYIPACGPRSVTCAAGALYTFRVSMSSTWICLCLQDPAGEPMAGKHYRVQIGGEELEGETDAEGWIKRRIPPFATSGQLQLWPDAGQPDVVVEWPLHLGHLDPQDKITGVKARLNNLGYYCGDAEDEEQDEQYKAAVRAFQDDQGLTANGVAGAETQERLQALHGV
jgi:Putative peptidoglycan binding domain